MASWAVLHAVCYGMQPAVAQQRGHKCWLLQVAAGGPGDQCRQLLLLSGAFTCSALRLLVHLQGRLTSVPAMQQTRCNARLAIAPALFMWATAARTSLGEALGWLCACVTLFPWHGGLHWCLQCLTHPMTYICCCAGGP